MADLKTCFSAAFKSVDMNVLIGEAIEKNASDIAELNRLQLDKGLDSKGKSLGEYKNIKYKGRLKPIDLKLKGDFRSKIDVFSGKNEAFSFSHDRKSLFLTAKSIRTKNGKTITRWPDALGVAKEDYEDVEQSILPDLQESFKRTVISNV